MAGQGTTAVVRSVGTSKRATRSRHAASSPLTSPPMSPGRLIRRRFPLAGVLPDLLLVPVRAENACARTLGFPQKLSLHHDPASRRDSCWPVLARRADSLAASA